MRNVIALLSLTVVVGCGPRVDYLQYRGPQNWPTGSAFVRVVEGFDVYEGLPERPYEVVGMIDVWHNQPFYTNASATNDVVKYTKEHNGNAIVWLSKRIISSGALRMTSASTDPATINTGDATQPLVLRTRGSASAHSSENYDSVQYQEDVWVEPQRSTILVIRWK